MSAAARTQAQTAEDSLLKERLARGQLISFTARGASMRPWICDGDEVSLAPLRGSKPRLGEVLLYERGGVLILHRLLWRRGAQLWLKGDALPALDEAIPQRAALARLVALRRGGSWCAIPRRRPLALSLPLGAARALWALRSQG